MGEYAGRLPLFHIDLYRLASATEALDGGLLDDRQATGVVLIEWPDRLGAGAAGRPARRPDRRRRGRARGGSTRRRTATATAATSSAARAGRRAEPPA